MHLTIAPRGILQIDDARFYYTNFAGKAGQYSREGDRYFGIFIDTEEMADALVQEGWNVKIKPPREEGDDPTMYLNVKVKFNGYGPNVYLVSNGRRTKLDEETIGILDSIDILNVDMDIAPSDYDINGKTGRAAYLRSMEITQRVDRFDERWADRNEDVPF